MSSNDWSWVAASKVGTSHLRVNRGCDDSGACIFVKGSNESALLAVCSDGAGSAQRSAIGSRIVAKAFCRNARQFLSCGGRVADLTEEVVSTWLDDIRDRIASVANQEGLTPRDYAATLVGCVASGTEAKILHVGDGAVVYRPYGSELWLVGSWPEHGEYASTTYFVTDSPEPKFRLTSISEKISEIALFTDGIEHLVLDFATNSAFGPFFDQIFSGFRSGRPGKDRGLSGHLGRYLDSQLVCDRTDDDKTLLLARQTLHVSPQEHL